MDGSAPALTNFACVGVLSSGGGVLRCRAHWLHNGGTQGPKLSEFTESQSLSNNALLEVIAQRSFQNQELIGLLATQQSSTDPGRSSGGLQMETKPLDMVDPASVSTAWDTVMNKKNQERDLPALNSSEKRPFFQVDSV